MTPERMAEIKEQKRLVAAARLERREAAAKEHKARGGRSKLRAPTGGVTLRLHR